MAKKNRISNTNEIKEQLSDVKTEVVNGTFIFTNKMPLGEFANKIGINANNLIKRFLLKGKFYQINHILEEEEIAEICLEQGLDFKKEENIDAGNFLNEVKFNDSEQSLIKRPPIITVMGHVDHGKTSLIDYIRKTNVVETESSGITQHTGAYQIVHNGSKITFIDTPGHEAFGEMRSRGAKVTDIVILVVAADDGVMPQTKEAILHAKAANVPIIVFVNKMDKPQKNLDKIKRELMEVDVLIEEYGGDVQVVYGSALKGEGINDLFNAIILLADILDLKANPNRYPVGTVIESKIDKGVGSITTVIIENGTLYKGDFIVAGSSYGRIRSIKSPGGSFVDFAEPGMPVKIAGLNNTPLAGDRFIGFEDEKYAKKLATNKAQIDKSIGLYEKNQNVQLDSGKKIFNVLIRADMQGTAEAIKNKLSDMENSEAAIRVIGTQVGQITSGDILLAQASNAMIITFNIKISPNTKQAAKQAGVKIISNDVIYKIIEDVQTILDGEKPIVYEEKKIGSAHCIKVFFYSKVGTIAGCMLDDGVVKANCKVKVFRKRKLIHEGVIESLKRETNDVKVVEKGKDFGTHIRKFNDVQEDDILEFFEDVPVSQ
ncbi:translation initiation factor IF-2 [Mycoplasma tauri]|uniref:translation initiation factor IF-2 n=1 Tax=Mycoplasma tauri TaxID=547987 RepID=UPI001CBB97D7|nr:translation initiation factor IF-2 [Mycoplasma tauri]MBZ4203351.1 translation initiation factor IF-2 [Mycoplasma tauri]MBZ4218001.1 translation initiation factor IF-2 [Mycoplasma tauri]MBZ4226569.1 translation initiation factor IF-2 [Mycoplasma tauri]